MTRVEKIKSGGNGGRDVAPSVGSGGRAGAPRGGNGAKVGAPIEGNGGLVRFQVGEVVEWQDTVGRSSQELVRK